MYGWVKKLISAKLPCWLSSSVLCNTPARCGTHLNRHLSQKRWSCSSSLALVGLNRDKYFECDCCLWLLRGGNDPVWSGTDPLVTSSARDLLGHWGPGLAIPSVCTPPFDVLSTLILNSYTSIAPCRAFSPR